MNGEMTEAEMVADIERILVENARLLGEKQDVFLRRMTDGRYRVQTRLPSGRWQQGRRGYKDYGSLERTWRAAQTAHANAQSFAERRERAS